MICVPCKILLFAILLQLPADSPATVPVRPSDIDIKGHVNNSKYLEYLQQGRWEWLDRHGVSDGSLRESGVILVVARIEIDFRLEISYPCRLTVATRPEKVAKTSFVFFQKISRDDGMTAAGALVTMVAIDVTTRKPTPLPDRLVKAISVVPE